MERDAELLLGIAAQVLLDERGGEAVEPRSHGRVGGEDVACSRDGQCDFEGLPGLLHEAAGAFQHRKGRMPFIQVADLRLDAKRGKQSPSADPKEHLLPRRSSGPPP